MGRWWDWEGPELERQIDLIERSPMRTEIVRNNESGMRAVAERTASADLHARISKLFWEAGIDELPKAQQNGESSAEDGSP
jgi:hypothetical protein